MRNRKKKSKKFDFLERKARLEQLKTIKKKPLEEVIKPENIHKIAENIKKNKKMR